MGLLSATNLSPWLVAFSLNIAMGLVLILIYNAARSALRDERRQIATAPLIGLLFGISAIVSMNYPVHTSSGLSIDARTVFVLVGSLFGGPIGGVITATLTGGFRLFLGGVGSLAGFFSIVVTTGVGLAGWWWCRKVSDLRAHELWIIGFINALLITIEVDLIQWVDGAPGLPAEAIEAGFVIFPLGTVLLGYAMGMSHHRMWSRQRQRLVDIVETTTDLIWETDAEGRLTYLSDRHFDILGVKPEDYIGQRPTDVGSLWIDEATARIGEDAYATHKPYSGLLKRTHHRDGSARILLLNARPRFDDRGRFQGYRGTSQDVTASQHMEDELRRSRDGLVRAQRMGQIGSGEVDFITGVTIWSDEMYAMMGFDKAGGASLERYLPYVHPDDRSLLELWRERNNKGEQSPPIEYRFVRPDGELRWFHREAAVECDAQGRAVKLYTTQQDVTEQRQTENALRRSLRTQRMMSDCNQILIHARDEAQLVRDICRTICEIGGYAQAWVGLVGHDAEKSIVPVAAFNVDGQAVADAYVQTLNITWDENDARGRGPIGRCIRSRQVVIARDTDPSADLARWRSLVKTLGFRSTLTLPLYDESQVFAVLGIYAKISDAFDSAEIEMMTELGSDIAYGLRGLRTRAERNEATRELAETKDALRAIMDHTIDGLVTIDDQGTILTFSRPAEAIFGLAADEAIGGSVSMLIQPPQGSRSDDDVTRVLAAGLPRIVGRGREVVGRRKDGTTFPMDLQVEEIPSAAAGRRFVATVRDVTLRKQTEAQLQQAQKMEAMGQLTGGVAHDFNNLLGVILGRLELLALELEDNPRQQAWARTCVKAVERGATLTKSLLAFARQQALEPIELDLNGVLGDLEDLMQRTLGEAYEFRVTKQASLWTTEADPGQLQNALLNLVLNARDAMPNGGRVTVTTSNAQLDSDYAGSHQDLRPGDYVLMSVADTGMGMSPEVMARAFEPFYTTKGTGKGSGLGLSMVYGFVKQSGGHVAIYSEPGHGTNIRIYLPRKHGAAVVEEQKPQAIVGGTETILIVEDNEDMRDLTRLQLERLGYTIFDAGDAADGLTTLTDHPEIALLLTDVVLPHGQNGPQLAQKALAHVPHLAVVFMSGYNEQHEEIEKARGDRPLRLLQKPFHVAALAAQLRAALDDANRIRNSDAAAE
ncbi:MAG TPA: PAS domain S-box protein [Magnetospirillaceae bacterium]|jgi:PAS domain S-box-containing protein